VDEIDADRAQEYWLAITAIEAQEALVQMQVADYPHAKPEQRKRVYRKMHKLAYPRFEDSKSENLGSIEDLVSFLRGNLGNG
jgi:hypothetical protein